MNDLNVIRCPWCEKKHELKNTYLDITCECGSKYYAITHEWWNKNTSSRVYLTKYSSESILSYLEDC